MLALLAFCAVTAPTETTATVPPETRPPPRPGRHMVEIGLGLGAFIPSSEHELYDSTSAPQSAFDRVGADLVLRASYFPLPFIGVEGEMGLSPLGDQADDTDLLYAGRGHLMLQYPARFTPFVLGGGGFLGVDSPRGGDVDRAAHWGVGLKYYHRSWLSFRIDGRHLVSAAEGPASGNTNHFEALAGVSITLFRAPERPRPPPPLEEHELAEVVIEPDPQPETRPEPEDANRGLAVVDPIEVVREALSAVQFGFDSAEIHPSQHTLLDQIFDALAEAPDVNIVITGHTCSMGSDRYNQGLSRRRAEAVREHLMARGLGPERVRVEAAGENEPKFPNDSEAHRSANRRTEFGVRAAPGGPIAGRP